MVVDKHFIIMLYQTMQPMKLLNYLLLWLMGQAVTLVTSSVRIFALQSCVILVKTIKVNYEI